MGELDRAFCLQRDSPAGIVAELVGSVIKAGAAEPKSVTHSRGGGFPKAQGD